MAWRTEESSCGSQPKEGNDPSLRSLRSLGRAGKVRPSSTRSREAMLIAPLSEHVGESCSRQGKMTCWWLEFDWFKGESSKTLKIHNEECLVYLLILHIAEMLGESNRVPRFSLVAISSLHLSFGLHVQRCSKFGSVVTFILSCSRSAFDKLNMDQQDQQVRSSLLKSHIGESLLQDSSQVKPMPYFGGWCGSHVGSETESKLCALASSWQKLDAKPLRIATAVKLHSGYLCLSWQSPNVVWVARPRIQKSETTTHRKSHRGKGRSSIEAHWHLQPQRCVCAAKRHTKTTKPIQTNDLDNILIRR